MYRTINSLEDAEALQFDLNTLLKWADTWQMQFNVKKCTVMRLTQKKFSIISIYTMQGTIQETVNYHPYLDVTITDNLSWTPHINNITKKANIEL